MKTGAYIAVFAAGLLACTSANKNTEERSMTAPDSLMTQRRAVAAEFENPDPAHNSQNSVDWAGAYEAVLPCADCPGIQTTLLLNEDGTFEMKRIYLERDVQLLDKGTFTWQNNGSVVHLLGEGTDIKIKVGENRLFQLDQEGNEISGALADRYIYTKQSE